MVYVYILRCKDNSLYCGWTNDLQERVLAHNEGRGGKYTRSHAPVKLAYYEICQDKSAALKREIAIKALTKAQKEELIKMNEAFLNFPEIETDRLKLRHIAAKDEAAYDEMTYDYDVNNFWACYKPGERFVHEGKEAPTWEAQYAEKYRKKSMINWVIADKNTDEFLGEIFLYKFKNKYQAEVGYRLKKAVWGKGYASEVLKAALDYAFSKMGMKRIEVRCLKGNDASRHVIEKCGFVLEGTVRNGAIIDIFYDYYLYGMLDTDER